MWKPQKASLRKVLLPDEYEHSFEDLSGEYVIDDGTLLHRVHWSKNMTFEAIADEYVKYVRRSYGSVFVVFDGYEDPMSIKTTEHKRRLINKGPRATL